MRDFTQITYTFEPAKAVESELSIVGEGFEFLISNGKIEAKLDQEILTARKSLRNEFEEMLRHTLIGFEVAAHLPIVISAPNVIEVRADGSKTTVIEAKPGVAIADGWPADISGALRDGTVVDSAKARISEQQHFSSNAARYASNDLTFARMLRSYSAAVHDPEDELIHLYEIRDALQTHFGKKKKALSELDIHDEQWKRLGDISNDLPLTQGRHRGQNASGLRAATEDELNEARRIARSLIKAYIQFLSKSPK